MNIRALKTNIKEGMVVYSVDQDFSTLEEFTTKKEAKAFIAKIKKTDKEYGEEIEYTLVKKKLVNIKQINDYMISYQSIVLEEEVF